MMPSNKKPGSPSHLFSQTGADERQSLKQSQINKHPIPESSRKRREGKIFIISGPSQVGKDTIVRKLWRARDLNPARIITNTTRAMRPGEQQGVTYNFMSEEAFESLIKRGELLEWACVRRAYFGTPKAPVLQSLALGKNVIMQIDVQGAAQVKAKLPDTVLIFITAESAAEVRRRIFASTKMTLVQKTDRWREAQQELRAIPKFQYLVVNKFDQLDATMREVRSIIRRKIVSATKA